MKKHSTIYHLILAVFLITTGSIAQELYTKTGSDKSWNDIIKDGDIPVGTNSTKGIKGSTIDVKNELVEGGLYTSYGVEQNIAIHTVGNGTVPRKDFDKWSRWYQEDGDTQVFRLLKGEYNVRNDRKGAPRIEAESKLTWKKGEWQEWVGRYTIVKAQTVNLFQIFGTRLSDGKVTGLAMIGLRKNGEVYWNKRDGKTFKTMVTNAEGKSFDIKVRDNGEDYEIYLNGSLFVSHSVKRNSSKTSHFRWGMYSHDAMKEEAIIFVSHAQINGEPISAAIGPDGYSYAVNESETVQISEVPYDVAYGQDGSYEYLLEQREDVPCSNEAFGNDPASGVQKYCFTRESKVPYTENAALIPGIIEAEHYDYGGAGRSYQDNEAENRGDIGFREESGVDIDSGANDTGYVVGWMSTGEWLEYTVEVSKDGMYNFNFSVSSLNGTGVLGLDLDGEELMTGLQVPQTGDWDVYTTFSSSAQLSQGIHVIRLHVEQNGFNLDKIEVTSNSLNITDLTKDLVAIYPNPSLSGVFNLTKKISYSVYSIGGKKVLEGFSNMVNLSDFSEGIYILKSNEGIAKLIK